MVAALIHPLARVADEEDEVARVAVEMPKLGYDMETGRIGGWLKAVGDHIERGEVIAEIETDKAMVEMEAVVSGTLVEIVHGAGAEVPIGDAIAFVDQDPG